MCDPIILKNVHIDQFNAMADALKASGFEVEATDWTKGEIRGKGITIQVSASFPANTGITDVILKVVKKPFYISCGRIRKEIAKHYAL